MRGLREVLWISDFDTDLRNPTRSEGNNILTLVNKYMDIYLEEPENLQAKAKAEKYAKITAKTIICSDGSSAGNYGQNAYFYDARRRAFDFCNPACCGILSTAEKDISFLCLS